MSNRIGRPFLKEGEDTEKITTRFPSSVVNKIHIAARADGCMYADFPAPGVWIRRVVMAEFKRREKARLRRKRKR